MCGICGVIQLGGGKPRPVVEPGLLDAMTDLMVHRGPSDRGTYLADGVALGVRRLSIVDVEGGHQPFANEDAAIWAIQNGELFNHVELRRSLAGHSLVTHCDTEVLPHLYEEHGDDFPTKLRGMFAIAIWDSSRRRLVVARDRLGIKPLYYASADGLLVFASELKPLLASGLIEPQLDPDAVDAYLSLGYFPTPYTPLRGVRKLPPGHRLVVDDGEVALERYWTYPRMRPEPMSLDEAAERVLDKLDESVRLRLMADVPLGAMLSGGLDSSMIVALMARQMGRPVETFSVGFAEDPNNELADARAVARKLETDHHELELSISTDTVPLDELAWYLDEPLADLSALGFYALSQLASEHVTVALSGQGADELFGGYAAHRNAALVGAWQRTPGARQAMSLVASRGPAKARRAARILSTPEPAERFLIQQSLADDELRRSLYATGFAPTPGRLTREVLRGHLRDLPDEPPLRVALQLHAQLALVDDMLQYFDRASMAHSLEVRVPFLDHELVELAATIPDKHKVRRRATKIVLKRAARDLLPEHAITKPKVGFFNAMMGQWIAAAGRDELFERVLDPGAATTAVFEQAALSKLVRDQMNGRLTRPRLLVAIVMLELWLSTVVPRATAAGAAAARV